MPRVAAFLAVVALAAGVVWRFPLFHVVSVQQVEAERREAAFDAHKFAADFWQNRLTPQFDEAADAATVLAALRDNPQQAREKFGRQVGVSRTAYYFIRGRGTILSVGKQGLGVSLNADTGPPEVLLATGKVFGNAVRDATGLLLSADFANSQHFNELAGGLNRLAESGPIKQLAEHAAPGRRVEFVGCAAITGDKLDAPLKVIPIDVTIE